MAAYFTHCDLQPVHLVLTLRTALNLFYKASTHDGSGHICHWTTLSSTCVCSHLYTCSSRISRLQPHLLVDFWNLDRNKKLLLRLVFLCIYEQSTNHISLKKKKRPRCYVKSPTAQDVFRPMHVFPCSFVSRHQLQLLIMLVFIVQEKIYILFRCVLLCCEIEIWVSFLVQ